MRAALAAGGYGAREIVVRVNGLATPWGHEDLAMAVQAKPQAILVPKVNSARDVAIAEDLLAAKSAHAIDLWVMIETPLAILNIGEIAAAAKHSRLACFVMGTNDLAKEMRARQTPAREAFLPALSLSVLAARAHGLDAIDGVFNGIDDPDGFEAVCRQGLALGFDGKTLIHPSQIAPANRIFAPEAEEIAHAQAVIAAFAAPENAGKGVLKVDGKMTELLHLEQAKRVVAMAEAIAAREAASID